VLRSASSSRGTPGGRGRPSPNSRRGDFQVTWQALIVALEAEGPDYGVHALQAHPFAVEFGPRLTEALG
jgi:hypothetical protein